VEGISHLLFEPGLYASGGNSLLRDLTAGHLRRILSLVDAGYFCGVLWEFTAIYATVRLLGSEITLVNGRGSTQTESQRQP
jgi:hypothetical protein